VAANHDRLGALNVHVVTRHVVVEVLQLAVLDEERETAIVTTGCPDRRYSCCDL
jgi:hypothetical protein